MLINNYKFIGNRNAPLILFLHGFMGSGIDWNDVAKLLENHFCCLMIDLPGHGLVKRGNLNKTWSMENIAMSIIQFLQQESIDKCNLVGYSMGGRLALYLALRYPRFFSRIVLESASPGLKTEKERQLRKKHDQQLAERIVTTNLNTFLNDWYNLSLFETVKLHPEFQALLERRLQNSPQSLAKSLKDMGTGTQPPLWSKLRENKIPLLLVVGEKDAKFKTIAHKMVELNAASEVEIIANCGHNIHFEKPELFANRIKVYFDSN